MRNISRNIQKQNVTNFVIFRDFSPDTNLETPPSSREELLKYDGDDGSIGITVFVRLRGRKGVYSNSLSCRRYSEDVRCAVDCDGGSFKLEPAGDALIAENLGFIVIGGCGAADEDEEAHPVFVAPGADDRTFRLDPLPVRQCLAIRDAQNPAWARMGPPLRTRLDRDDAVCFAKSYDAAHLKSHPAQTIRHISVLKPAGQQPEDPDWPAFKLAFRAELADGRKVEKEASCAPDNHAYACIADMDRAETYRFYLTRAGANDMMLRDRKGVIARLFGEKLGLDDRLFRLHAAAAADCAR